MKINNFANLSLEQEKKVIDLIINKYEGVIVINVYPLNWIIDSELNIIVCKVEVELFSGRDSEKYKTVVMIKG